MSLSVARPMVVVPGRGAGGDAPTRRMRITLVAKFDPSPPLRLADGLIWVGV